MTTFLTGVNEVLERGKILDSSNHLTSLTDAGIQYWIDLSKKVWNELLDHVYTQAQKPLPRELAENTITLVADDRDYALASDLVQLHFPLIDETNGRYILEFRDGYLDLVKSQLIPSNYTGQPFYACIRPTDDQLYLDRIPQSTEAGQVYKYRYDKDVSLSLSSDTFPFKDAVYRALLPAAYELWALYANKEYNNGVFEASVGRAARMLITTQQRKTWAARPARLDPSDPLNG